MVTADCAILVMYPPCLERDQQTFSISGRHISSQFASFPLLLFSSATSLRIPWAYAAMLQAFTKAELCGELEGMQELLASVRQAVRNNERKGFGEAEQTRISAHLLRPSVR
jgi:hypothetical protein